MQDKPIKVLLIEDNLGDALMIQEMLAQVKGAQFDLEYADRLSKGLERLAEGAIDVVLLDLSLPDSRGINTFARAHAEAPGVPIVVLTVLDNEMLAIKAMQKGVQDYLVKGKVDSELLKRSVRYAIERQRMMAELEREREELQKTVQELRTAQRQLIRSEKMASLGMVAAGMAHEILNPLNIIYMLAQVALKDDGPDEELKESIERIKLQCKRIEKIIDSLRHFAREKEPKKSPVDLHKLLNETLTLMGKPMLLENIVIKRKYRPIMPELTVDGDQIDQVFINMITNARDAMPEGGELIISTDLVKRHGRRTAKISFSDTGCGMKEEILPNIFDPFFTTKSVDKGTGLGLSICHGIVEKHDGSIEVESRVGEGTTFSIYLPTEDGTISKILQEEG